MLTFCNSLSEAALGFDVSIDDFEFMEEHQDASKGICNVKDLSLRFRFHFDPENRRTYWWMPGESKKTWLGGNEKSQVGSY